MKHKVTFQDLLNYFSDRPDVQEEIKKETAKEWPDLNGDYSSLTSKSLPMLLNGLFIYSNTEKGLDYWAKIYGELHP